MKITSLKNLEKIFGNEHRKENDFKLDNLINFLQTINNPHDSFPHIIHIAGTNGKGSTLAMIEALAHHHGLKTGMLTSPHLISYTERFRINQSPISENQLLKTLNDIYTQSKKTNIPLTLFEALFVAACMVFKKENIDIFLAETGLGGRLDSTNVLTSNISVITPIDFDHMEFLGNTIKKITQEKAGIIKPNSITLTNNTGQSLNIIKKTAEKQTTPVMSPKKTENISLSLSGTTFTYKKSAYTTPLIGIHQASNTALAIETIHQLNTLLDKKLDISPISINAGLKKTHWPGRIQVIQKNPLVIIDGAHNPHSINALIKTLTQLNQTKFTTFFSAKQGKNITENYQALKKVSKKIITVHSSAFMMATKEELKNKTHTTPISTKQMMTTLRKIKEPVLITGSLYFLGELLDLHQN